MIEDNPYIGAYPWLVERRGVWREIARFVGRDAGEPPTVVELGAGFCDFINQFRAARRIAFDLNPDSATYAAPGVDVRIADATTLPGVADGTVDLVFASNFLEHLSAQEIATVLSNVRRVLRKKGRLILIQPNHRRCADHYFDDPTHKTVFDDHNIRGYLEPYELHVVKLVPGQLPFSMKSRLPKWPMLTRLYLHSPLRPLGKQMYVVAERG